MDRLTKKNSTGYERKDIHVKNQQLIDKLAAYEDAEENGEILLLPCKTVWYILDKGSRFATVAEKDISELPVYEIENIDKDGHYWSSKEKAEIQLEKMGEVIMNKKSMLKKKR